MGWIWSSSESSDEPSHTQAPTTNAESSRPRTAAPKESSPPAKRNLTRDEIADSEFQSFLEEIQADMKSSSAKHNRGPQPPRAYHKNLEDSERSEEPGPSRNLTLEEDLLPTDMSCRQAFDAAFYCQSLGGQFNNVYRYGGIRSCSENWSDFWFCMRMKSYAGDKESKIREHYKRKALKYKVGPSSEDVWESRHQKLDWGEAFSEPVDMPNASDEEWNLQERIRRQQRIQSIQTSR